MRAINIANAKKRDAEVGFISAPRRSAVELVLPDGRKTDPVIILKSTANLRTLLGTYGDLPGVGQALIDGDPEIDFEQVGRILRQRRKLYLSPDGAVAYRVNLLQVVRNPDGTEKERRDLTKAVANVAAEIPLSWTGRKFPREKAVRSFVFSKSYQLRHTNGLTYDFLYEMAKELQESDALIFIGSGPKGAGPIVLTAGGEPYRGFLEGRVDGPNYRLVLHLTNMEIKPLIEEGGPA
ncbi:MAG: hypothetical protein LBS10_02400 [Gracilibacteraceae bacterium]|jgi:hypothetical protein|nr:hypothetical protein [Gracilibacteraceae bacterium]